MDSQRILDEMDKVIGEMIVLIGDLRGQPQAQPQGQPQGKFIDPVCWNCAKAYKFYLLDHGGPSYKPCIIWRTTKKCDFEPREGK